MNELEDPTLSKGRPRNGADATPKRASDVCDRLAILREDLFGARGKSEMARRLDIRPSTYDRYERDRVPPADLLVRISRIANVTLEWLLTGEGPKRPAQQGDVEVETLTRQFQEAITVMPGLRPGVSRLLAWVERLPRDVRESAPPTGAPAPRPDDGPADDSDVAGDTIPVGGSTSAGFAPGVRVEASEGPVAAGLAVAASRLLSTEIEATPFGEDATSPPRWLRASDLRTRYPDATAWRVEGQSMAPLYRDGDYVITSASEPAVEGQPCVASVSGEADVCCKVFHRDGTDILMIPVNAKYSVGRVAADDLRWAHRIVGVVRGGGE